MRLLLLTIATSLLLPIIAHAGPKKLKGIKLGWRVKTVKRVLKKRGWRFRSHNKKRCFESLSFYKGGWSHTKAYVFSILAHRGRVYQITWMPKSSRMPTYSMSQWARQNKRRRRYGKAENKIFRIRGKWRGWRIYKKWGRRFSIGLIVNRRSITVWSLQIRRMNVARKVERCGRR